MTRNKAYFFAVGQNAVRGSVCPYKGGWQRTAWLDGYAAGGMSAKARAVAEAKVLKAKMAASHPDHGGTCEAFRRAYAEWKNAELMASHLS